MPAITSERLGRPILLLLKTHSSFLTNFLQKSGYAVSEVRSPEDLVALCVSNPPNAVIVDVCQFGELEGWSIAQSIKMVKPSPPVILLFHGPTPEKVELPYAVDALASDSNLQQLLQVLGGYTTAKTAAQNENAPSLDGAFSRNSGLRWTQVTGAPFSDASGVRVTESTAAIQHKRRTAVDKAKITWKRNQVLRRSSIGRFLLALEGCLALVNDEGEMKGRRLTRLLDELSHACELADEAGVQNGWVRERLGIFSLVFTLSSGNVVFNRLDESLDTDAPPPEPIASSNSWVLARAIAEVMNKEIDSTPRRSTRIPTDVLVEVQGEGFAYPGGTITVNLHGALVSVAAPLRLGDRVTLHVHRTGKSAPAAIVFADYTQRQFCIELENPENIWGVTVPPADWNIRLSNDHHVSID